MNHLLYNTAAFCLGNVFGMSNGCKIPVIKIAIAGKFSMKEVRKSPNLSIPEILNNYGKEFNFFSFR